MACRNAFLDEEEPTSLAGAMLDVLQEGALNAAETTIDSVQKGILFLANVYAFHDETGERKRSKKRSRKRSTDKKKKRKGSKKDNKRDTSKKNTDVVTAAQQVHVPATSNTLSDQHAQKREESNSRRESGTFGLSEGSGSESDSGTREENATPAPDVALYTRETSENRDNSQESFNVQDLIVKFNKVGMPFDQSMSDSIDVVKARVAAAQSLRRQDPPLSRSGLDPAPTAQARQESHYNSHSIEDSMDDKDNNTHEVFRPRSLRDSSQDPERFSYLIAEKGTKRNTQAKPLQTPFQELHRDNENALFKESRIIERSKINTQTEPPVEQSISNIQDKTQESEIIDIRKEIEDIHRLLTSLEKQRQKQQWFEEIDPTQCTDPPAKDPQKMQDLVMLISRLQRLSRRHEELKVKQAAEAAQVREKVRHALVTADEVQELRQKPPVVSPDITQHVDLVSIGDVIEIVNTPVTV